MLISLLKRELTIAHISDIQTGKVGGYEEKVFEILRQQKPDVIFHTGDLVQVHGYENRENELRKLGDLFKGLDFEYGVYNVEGNIDHAKQIRFFDEAAGVETLRNENIVIKDESFLIDVLGLAWADSKNGSRAIIEEWVKNREGAFKIVLGHAPDYVLGINDFEIDLCLAGHTHGGQVSIPFLGPIINFSDVPKKWSRGFRRVNKVNLNVSSGIGAEHAGGLPSIRFNCRPSITIIKVVPAFEDLLAVDNNDINKFTVHQEGN